MKQARLFCLLHLRPLMPRSRNSNLFSCYWIAASGKLHLPGIIQGAVSKTHVPMLFIYNGLIAHHR